LGEGGGDTYQSSPNIAVTYTITILYYSMSIGLWRGIRQNSISSKSEVHEGLPNPNIQDRTFSLLSLLIMF
jgi:hypothetical protein